MSETLIIFTRYPEPGKTKTRMIPKLGKEGAANLQRKMTEHTVKQATKLKKIRKINTLVYFTGCEENLMKMWLGEDIKYCKQAEGDLGKKMLSAFTRAFNNDRERVVIIGIDCPDIDESILDRAFESLKNDRLVLGPAKDGGYYLIGLNTLVPELFFNIDWGTNSVLATTKQIAKRLNLSTQYLPLLSDIDRPEDLKLLSQNNIKIFP